MEDFGSKLSGDLTFKYGTSTPAYGGGSSTPASVTTPSYTAQERQMDGSKGMAGATGGSGVEELVEGGGGNTPGGGSGRKKKKKHKSGEDSSAAAKPSAEGVEDELVDAALPMLSDSQDVEDLLFPSTLPPPGGTLVGGQYLLNNSLLDQILTEKKMQLLQSPEVIEFLRKQLAKK